MDRVGTVTAPLVGMSEHSYEQQPGEVRIQLEGPSIEDVFDEAARALAELLATPTEDPPGAWVHVLIESAEPRALLARWCNELIERTAVDQLVYADIEIDEVTDQLVRARIRGVPIGALRTSVKIATMHDLRIETGPDAVIASVIVQV
ncbi:MAG: archease [Kofleriaceae bacterium]